MNFRVNGNVVKLYGVIWEGDGSYISNQLEALEGTDELVVRLHTPGGSVIDGNIIGNTLKSLNREIHIIVDGMAASMGAVLLTYADKVSIRSNAFIMIHEPQGDGRGTAKDLRSTADVLDSMRANFISVFSTRTGKGTADVEKWLNGDNWFDALKAKNEGLVDAIVDLVIPQEQMNALRNMKITALWASTKSEADKYFTFESNNNSNLNNNSKKIEMNKAELIQALGLKGVTADSSDTAIINAIKEQKEEALAKATKAEGELQSFKDADKTAKKNVVIAVVDTAVKEGKIKAEQKETFVGIGNTSGIEALNIAFAAMSGRKTIVAQINGGGSETQGKENWDWDKWQAEDSKGLEAMEKTNLEGFKVLYKTKYGVEFSR